MLSTVTYGINKELAKGEGLNIIVDRFRASLIRQVLLQTNGNKSKAARILKTHRNTLDRWVKRLDIQC